GIALVNPGAIDATAVLTLRDSNGQLLARELQILRARGHLARYVTEIFPMMPEGFRGSITFESNQPLGAVALLDSLNRYGESVYITFPVINLADVTAQTTVFPHLAVGGGYSTQFILTNPSSTTMRGQIRLTAQDGSPLAVSLGNSNPGLIPYEIPPQGTLREDLSKASGLVVGWGEVLPDPNNLMPMAIAAFQYRVNAQLVTGACIPATRSTTLARLWVDNTNSRTGVAIANSSNSSPALTIRL